MPVTFPLSAEDPSQAEVMGTANSSVCLDASRPTEPVVTATPSPVGYAMPAPTGDNSLETALREIGVKELHIRAAMQRSAMTGESLTAIMRGSDYGFLSPEKIARVNAKLEGLEYFQPHEIESIDPEAVRQITSIDRFQGFIPVAYDKGSETLTVLIPEARDSNNAQNALGTVRIKWMIASERVIQAIYRRFFSNTEKQFDDAYKRLTTVDPNDAGSSAVLREVICALIRHACYAGASDIGLQPMKTETGGIIRLKINGTGQIFRFLEWPVFQRIVVGLFNDAGKAEKVREAPQEGKFEFKVENGEIERYSDIANRYAFRVEFIYTVDTKSLAHSTIVMRILDQQADVTDFDQLGFDAGTEARLRDYFNQQNGLILVTGPTGSGKTTTLYAGMSEIDPIERWVQSIENPIEYGKGTWMQYQVPKIGSETDGAKALLKGLLRNAPDVVLMGEVRDAEICEVLVELANTGHLVFATLHTNNAALSISRIKKFGVDMAGVASVLLGVLAQRLIKTLCPTCKVPDDSAETVQEMRKPWLTIKGTPTPFKVGEGCSHCAYQGYRRRRMIYELLNITPEICTMIERGDPPSEIARHGIDEKMTLRANALRLVAKGITSMDEVKRLGR